MVGSEQPANRTRSENIPAIERASGRPWDEWLKIFAARDAKNLGHPEIARIARAAMPAALKNPDWWAQGTTIAYEQHVGLRVPGQSSTGTFRVSASRTLVMDRDDAIDAWVSAHGASIEHLGHASGKPRQSRTGKRSFWRFNLDGAGRVEIAATPKGDDRVIVSVSHEGLPDEECIEQWRAHWKALLVAL